MVLFELIGSMILLYIAVWILVVSDMKNERTRKRADVLAWVAVLLVPLSIILAIGYEHTAPTFAMIAGTVQGIDFFPASAGFVWLLWRRVGLKKP
jgi:hypothetical protein